MDERLRELERRAQAGDPGAAARLLRERLRSGRLQLEHVLLAAFLGDETALAAVDGRIARYTRDDGQWLETLAAWGPLLLIRAAAALHGASGVGESTYQAARAYCDAPTPARAAAVRDAARDAGSQLLAELVDDAEAGREGAMREAVHRLLFETEGGRREVRTELRAWAQAGPASLPCGRLEAIEAALVDPAEAAKELRRRVRAGELSKDRVRLASALGDPVARRALNYKPIKNEQRMGLWLGVLDEYDPLALPLAGLAIARYALRRGAGDHPDETLESLAAVVAAADEYVMAGRPRAQLRAVLDGQDRIEAAIQAGPPEAVGLQEVVFRAIRVALKEIGSTGHTQEELFSALEGLGLDGAGARVAVRSELSAWALSGEEVIVEPAEDRVGGDAELVAALSALDGLSVLQRVVVDDLRTRIATGGALTDGQRIKAEKLLDRSRR